MRTHVSFKFPAEFVPAVGDDGILGVQGVDWFVERLRKIPELTLHAEPVQEDWGVFIRVKRRRNDFWVGLSSFGDQVWLAHIHRFPLGWLWRLFSPTKNQFSLLADDLHAVLASDAVASDIRWYRDDHLREWKARPHEA